MAFYIRSAERSALTFSREQEIVRRSIPTGVFTGLQAYRGSTDFRISLHGGVAAVNGIVFYDDTDHTDIFDLGAPAGDEHHILLVTYNPETDDEPLYTLKSGTYAAPPSITPDEASYGIILANIFVPSTALSINDAVIANRPASLTNEEITQYLGRKTVMSFQDISVKQSGSDYTLHFRDARLWSIAPMKDAIDPPNQSPMSLKLLDTPTTSTHYTGGYELSITPAHRFVVFYTRGDNSASGDTVEVEVMTFADLTTDMLAAIYGNDDGTFSGEDDYPFRSNFVDITIIAAIDTAHSTVFLGDGQTIRVGDEINSGLLSAYTQSISSTAYATTASGDINIDDLITNIATLAVAGLDEAYDGFEAGSADGAGRSITVDAGAVELNNVINVPAPTDKWLTPLRLDLDSTATGTGEYHERAIDVVSTDVTSMRKAMAQRRPYYHASTGNLLHNITCTVRQIGTTTEFRFPVGFGIDVDNWLADHASEGHAEQKWVTFDAAGLQCNDEIYNLTIDVASGIFTLTNTEALSNLGSDFGVVAGGVSAVLTCTVWEVVTEIGQRSRVQDLEVQGTVRGAGRDTPLVLDYVNFTPSYTHLRDFINNVDDGDTAIVDSKDGYQIKGLEGDAITTTGFPTGQFCVDGSNLYGLTETTITAPSEISVYSLKTGGYQKTIYTNEDAGGDNVIAARGGKLAVAYSIGGSGNRIVELWDVESEVLEWTYTFDTSIDITSMLFASGDRIIVGGEWSGFSYKTLDVIDVSSGTSVTTLEANWSSHSIKDIECWSGRILTLTEYAGNACGLVLYDHEFNKLNDYREDDYDVIDIAMNDKYIAMLYYDGTSNYHLATIPIIYDTTPLSPIASVDIGTTCDSPGIVMDEDHVYLSYQDGSSMTQIDAYSAPDLHKVWNNQLAGESSYLATDLRALYGYQHSTNEVRRVFMGRQTGPWKKLSSTHQFDVFPYAAIPANGRF